MSRLLHVSLFLLLFFQTLQANNDRSLVRMQMQSEQRVALVIGNNNYTGSYLSVLHNPINDARAIRNVLTARNFEVIYAENVTARVLKKKLNTFYKKIRNGGVGFLYFSGHGMEFDGENYLIPIDAQLSEKADVSIDAIAVNTITNRMKRANNRLNIVVLDACRNDPFAKGGSGGLSKIEPEGMIVAYATSAGSVASDGRKGENGLFTKHLITYMKQEGLGLYQVFKKTRSSVYRESHKRQRPAIYDQIIGEEFFFTLPNNANRITTPKRKSNYSFTSQKPKSYTLTINPTPYDARVQITNIKPRYYKAMPLQSGSYTIKVSKQGYHTKTGKIDLYEDMNIDVALEKKALHVKNTFVSKPSYSNNTITHNGTTYYIR